MQAYAYICIIKSLRDPQPTEMGERFRFGRRIQNDGESLASESEESESERYLFDPHKKLIQSNNEKQLGSGDPY